MPIIDVEMVFAAGEKAPAGLAAALADAAGAVFGTPKGSTWVQLHELPAEHHAESGGGPGPDVRPVFVRVSRAYLPGTTELSEQASKLASAFGEVCGRPSENVHIIFEPPVMGRIAFGGKLVAVPAPGYTAHSRVWVRIVVAVFLLLAVSEVFALFKWVPIPLLQKFSALSLSVAVYGLGLSILARVKYLQRLPDISAWLTSPNPRKYVVGNFFLVAWLQFFMAGVVGLTAGCPRLLSIIGWFAGFATALCLLAYYFVHFLVIAPMAYLPNLIVAALVTRAMHTQKDIRISVDEEGLSLREIVAAESRELHSLALSIPPLVIAAATFIASIMKRG